MILDQIQSNFNPSNFTFILSTRGYEHLGSISNVDTESITYTANFNAANELSFKVYKKLDEEMERLWNDILDLKLIWVKELNEYFEVHINLDDGDNSVKSITATSLCEAELGQTILYDIEINTENDIARDDYVVTKFYNPDNHDGSLLHRIFSKIPHYHLKHVDTSLKNLQRSFSVDGTSVYDFLTGECAEQFNCMFTFNSTDRSISVYDLYTVCNDCGYRGEYNDICPECGSKNLKYLGDDTTIYIDKENLTDSVTFETNVDSIKNSFKLEAGDDYMTATIRSMNQNGSDYIYYLSEEQKKDMPDKLVKKLSKYDELYASYSEEYQTLLMDLYESIDKILYYTSEMMPTIEHSEVTSATEAAQLTTNNLSPLGLQSVTTSTSDATVNSALKNYAKVYVKTGYVKLDVNDGRFQYVGKDSNGYSYGMWTGNFKVTNYSDENDVTISNTISVKVYDNYQDFIEQKIKKNISDNRDDDGSVFDVLAIEDLNKFKDALKLYCLNRLTSFYDAIQGAIDVLIQEDQSSPEADLYNTIYVPYYNKLQACQNEIDTRQATINEWQHIYDNLELRKNEIQSDLNFESYLGDDLYHIFCAYKREDKYSNSNYTSDGLNNSEIFERAKEFLEVANKELYKSGEYQHSITTTLYNLLLIPEFTPILDSFKLGNWIRVGVDKTIYRLRLISYTIDFSSIENLSVTFSDVTKIHDSISDIESILSSAKSMATSYGYVSTQANNGQKAQNIFESFREEGLNSALYKIKNANTEDIVFDKHGISCRSYDDISDSYGDEQLKITHNILAFTDDNWKTTRTALGKMKITTNGKTEERYGLNADFVLAGYIQGSDIVAGNITGTNITGGKITGSNINNGNGTFSVDSKGKLVANSATINGIITASSGSSFGVWNITNDCIYRNSPIWGNDNGMYFGKSGLSIGNSFKVSSNGTLNASNATINGTIKTSDLTADGGTIGGANISSVGISFNYENTGWGLWGTTAHAGIVFHAGGNTSHIGSAPFRVYHDGSFVATNANIEGVIKATNGSFQGTINATSGTFENVTIKESCTVAGQSITGTIGNNVGWNGSTIGGGYIGSGLNGNYVTSGTVANDRITNTLSGKTLKNKTGNNNNTIELEGSSTIASISPSGIAFGNTPNHTLLGNEGLYFYVNGPAKTYLTRQGNFVAAGTKSRLAETENYGDRLLYCYETPSPMFGDVGEGIIDDNGECIIYIDDVFSETIDTQIVYQVFLQSYGKGECYVSERNSSYFVVYGTPLLNFGWEIKGVQLGYDSIRLDKPSEIDDLLHNNTQDVIENLEKYMKESLYNPEKESEKIV